MSGQSEGVYRSMTDGLVDKVAQLLCETGNVPGFKCCCPDPVDGWCEGGKMQLKARAAIEAMREPTAEMMMEGADFLSITPRSATNKCAGRVWEAMIDAALKEEK